MSARPAAFTVSLHAAHANARQLLLVSAVCLETAVYALQFMQVAYPEVLPPHISTQAATAAPESQHHASPQQQAPDGTDAVDPPASAGYAITAEHSTATQSPDPVNSSVDDAAAADSTEDEETNELEEAKREGEEAGEELTAPSTHEQEEQAMQWAILSSIHQSTAAAAADPTPVTDPVREVRDRSQAWGLLQLRLWTDVWS